MGVIFVSLDFIGLNIYTNKCITADRLKPIVSYLFENNLFSLYQAVIAQPYFMKFKKLAEFI